MKNYQIHKKKLNLLKLELNKKRMSGISSDPKMKEQIKLVNNNIKGNSKYQ